MENKKGQMHVEIIISFVIFVGFVIFLIVIFNPFKQTSNEGTTNFVFLNVDNNLSTSLSSVSIKINDPDVIGASKGAGCFEIDNIIGLKCNGERNLLVKDKEDNILKSQIVSDKIRIETSTLPENEDTFYTLYCSDEILPNQDELSNCHLLDINNEDYILGKISEKSVWSRKNLERFNATYFNDYNNLRKEIVPSGSDFAIKIFDFQKIEFDISNNIPQGVSVFAKSMSIEILNETADIKQASVTVITY